MKQYASRLWAFLLALALLPSLAACGGGNMAKPTAGGEPVLEDDDPAQTVSEGFGTDVPETALSAGPVRNVVRVEQTYSGDSPWAFNNATTLTAYDDADSVIWSWTSEVVPNDVQISDITEFAENQETVAIVVGGRLLIFERETGEIRRVAENVERPVFVMVDDQERTYLAGYFGPAMLIFDRNGALILNFEEKHPEVMSCLYSAYLIETVDDQVVRISFEGAADEEAAALIATKEPTEWGDDVYYWTVKYDMRTDTILPPER